MRPLFKCRMIFQERDQIGEFGIFRGGYCKKVHASLSCMGIKVLTNATIKINDRPLITHQGLTSGKDKSLQPIQYKRGNLIKSKPLVMNTFFFMSSSLTKTLIRQRFKHPQNVPKSNPRTVMSLFSIHKNPVTINEMKRENVMICLIILTESLEYFVNFTHASSYP